MKHSMLTLMLLAACDTTPVTPDDTDSDTQVIETDADTDVVDTEDTFTIDTAWIEETDIDTDALVETDLDCRFGEQEDCNGRCFPEYMYGDDFCDDGTVYPANFACVELNWDAADCDPIDDTDNDTDVAPQQGCRYVVEFTVLDWPTEIFWRIQTADGTIVARVDAGGYAAPGVFRTDVYLTDGVWRFIGGDTYGDGWHGGSWRIIDPYTNHIVSTGGTIATGASRQWTFNSSCDRTGCLMDIDALPGADGRQNGWELYTSGDHLAAEQTVGTLSTNTPSSRQVQVFNGTYNLRLRDLGFNGWDGGRVEARYRGDLLSMAAGLNSGASGTTSFAVQCDLEDELPYDAAPPTIAFDNCNQAGFEMTAVAAPTGAPIDISFAVFKANDWTRIVNKPPGSFTNATPNTTRADLTDGLYFVEMRDRGNNGWEGSTLRVRERFTDIVKYSTTLPMGANGGAYFRVACPPPVIDTDVDTDESDVDSDSDVDTDQFRTCLPGAQEDCNARCFPSTFIGDGVCDDGINSLADFSCATFNQDGGDCGAP